MFFSRKYKLNSPLSKMDVAKALSSQRLKIRDMDFEISEKENVLKVIPHAEHREGILTLPITHIFINEKGSNGSVLELSSKLRRIDQGVPYLILIFCAFLIVGAGILYWLNPMETFYSSIVMVGIGLLVFLIFWIKMEMGYFDYTRKIRDKVQDLAKG